MKRKDKKSKIFLMLALILCITIGYAALTTTLNITGNSEIKNAKWDIHFANLVVDNTSVEATTPAAIDSNKTTVNYAVNLVKPGDSYSFAVDVENAGTIDGMISTVTNTGLTIEQQKYVEYSITYANGKELKEKDGLKAGAKKNIKVKVKYKDDINAEDLPQADQTLNLTFTVEYVQADDTVTLPSTPIMKGFYFPNDIYKEDITKIVTKTNIDVPTTAIKQWDVSAAGDGSVVAYIEDDGSGNGTYQFTLGGDGGKVVVNEASFLFGNFISLKEADLSNLDTSNVTNMSYMFESCNELISLDLSSFDTGKVTNMEAMFSSCGSLTSLDLSSFDTSNVTNMRAMFQNCSSLVSLNLSKFDTSNVTGMEFMFSYCGGLTNLNLSKFNTSSVTDMHGMFNDCHNLNSLDLSSFDTSKVTNMSQMFSYCNSLTNLDLSNFNTSKVTDMSLMFYDCRKIITSITIKNSNVSSYSSMFDGASIDPGAQITVNYTSATSDLVDQMIATKSGNSNVVKGSLVS